MSIVNDEDRAAFAKIADVLIPEAEGMPAASAVGVPSHLLDLVLAVRADMLEPLLRALRSTRDLDGDLAVRQLHTTDPEAFEAVSLAASGGYYMSPTVRELINYPGQESRPFDPDKTTEYLEDGLLQPVIDRGSIYRPTPI